MIMVMENGKRYANYVKVQLRSVPDIVWHRKSGTPF